MLVLRLARGGALPLRAGVLVVLAALVWSSGGCGGSSSATTFGPLPRDFVGLSAPGVLNDAPAGRRRGLDAIAATGTGVVRQTFDWSLAERRPGRYDLSSLDGVVADAAARRLELLPVLFNPPAFRLSGSHPAAPNTSPPKDPAAMGRFAAVLVRRYGPRGTLWREHPRLPRVPIRDWQVWNEPNLPAYWGGHPDAAAYVRLLRAVGRAIKVADPSAEVVAAGLPNSRIGVPFEAYARAMFRAGAASALDVFALHPYAVDAAGVLGAVQKARALLDSQGETRARIWVTELGWASGGPASAFTVGEQGQAERIRTTFKELAARRRQLGVRGIVYFQWRDAPPPPGLGDFFGYHTGLLAADGRRKPAYAAFTAATGAR